MPTTARERLESELQMWGLNTRIPVRADDLREVLAESNDVEKRIELARKVERKHVLAMIALLLTDAGLCELVGGAAGAAGSGGVAGAAGGARGSGGAAGGAG
jgi:hypothetical protein